MHVAERNDSTVSNRQVSSIVHGPDCTLNPVFSKKVVVRSLLSDCGLEVILFFLLTIVSVTLQGFRIPYLFPHSLHEHKLEQGCPFE